VPPWSRLPSPEPLGPRAPGGGGNHTDIGYYVSGNGGFSGLPRLQFPIRKGGIFRPGAYSLAPRHFRIAQRRTERCKERACPEPCEGRGCAEAYICTASGRRQVRDSVEIDPAFAAAEGLSGDPGCGPAAHPPQAVAKLAGGPTAPGGNYFPSLLRTNSLTTLPSARPATLGMRIFITRPISFGEVAPASDTASLTIVSTSSNESCCGRKS
jgi:hypothetical protein